MNKFNIYFPKSIKIATGLSLLLFTTTLFAQQSSYDDLYQTSHREAQKQTQKEVDQQYKIIEDQARKNLDSEAVIAYEEIKRALSALINGEEKEAVTTIERATGKISVLLTRHPQKALLPINYQISFIDVAPIQISIINRIGRAIDGNVEKKRYPQARLMLNQLRSEINLVISHLPLGLYPAVLTEAAYLLEQKKTQEAMNVLKDALNTLVITTEVIPLPLVNVKVLLNVAEKKQKENKEVALALLTDARYELVRAKELGYIGTSEEYKALKNSIKEVEKHIKSNDQSGISSAFSTLKNKFKAFMERISKRTTHHISNNDDKGSGSNK